MQVADISTKPFTNAEKWRFALSLMSHVASKSSNTSSTAQGGGGSFRIGNL